jgi:co-chaperonin GroES (HSP10)
MNKIENIIKSFDKEVYQVSRDELKTKTDVSVLELSDFTMMWNTVLVFIPPAISSTGAGIIFTNSSVFDQLRERAFGFLAGMSATADSIGEGEQKLSDFYKPPLEIGDQVFFNPYSGVIYRDINGNCFRLMRIQDVKAFAKGGVNE